MEEKNLKEEETGRKLLQSIFSDLVPHLLGIMKW